MICAYSLSVIGLPVAIVGRVKDVIRVRPGHRFDDGADVLRRDQILVGFRRIRVLGRAADGKVIDALRRVFAMRGGVERPRRSAAGRGLGGVAVASCDE